MTSAIHDTNIDVNSDDDDDDGDDEGHSIQRQIWTNSIEYSIEFVDLFLTSLNFTEFSGCSPLNSPEFRKIPQNRVCIE